VFVMTKSGTTAEGDAIPELKKEIWINKVASKPPQFEPIKEKEIFDQVKQEFSCPHVELPQETSSTSRPREAL